MAINKLPRSGIADSAVTSAKVGDGLINAATEFPDCNIASTRLADCAVTNAKLSNSAITIRGTSTALGGSKTVNPDVDWQSVVVSDGSTVTTMVAFRGYFVNNTSAAGIVKLPSSAAIGDTIKIKDYAEKFGTNSLTIQRNGHNIQGVAIDATIETNRASITAVYVDSTKGWLFTDESNVGDLEDKQYVAATGGTVATSGNYKIHTFTGDGNFIVSNAGNVAGSNKVSYVVVAGGGGGGTVIGGGGGGGGYREGRAPAFDSYTASPLVAPDGITVPAQTYPVTVGAGGAVVPGYNNAPNKGNNSVFSTITSAGGGAGATLSHNSAPIAVGGSGGGSAYNATTQYAGNTPPVSPPQGQPGGGGENGPNYAGGGGGGAGGAGATGTGSSGGNGGAAVATQITGSPVTYSAGAGGSGSINNNQVGGTGTPGVSGSGMRNSPFVAATCGAANRGGGGGGKANGGPSPNHDNSTGGGSGIVIIRYKYQN